MAKRWVKQVFSFLNLWDTKFFELEIKSKIIILKSSWNSPVSWISLQTPNKLENWESSGDMKRHIRKTRNRVRSSSIAVDQVAETASGKFVRIFLQTPRAIIF